MASTFLPLTDDELFDKLRHAGEVMIGTWRDAATGRFRAGIRSLTNGGVMATSEHDDKAAAEKAARELEIRLDRLAEKRGKLRIRNLMDEAGDERGRPRH